MTAATEIVRRDPASFGGGRQPAAVSQATAIEQQRAIAEVQAAVVVAQSCPRNMAEAEREMEYVCGRMTMAERAFYQVTNRGTGPSVHLMRELARIWGNVDYGVKELHRDDSQGISEVQAFSWDIQKNTRSSRTFIVPHQRMVKIDGVQQRKDLVDLTDIYLNNQNVGARAVRECIDTILPRWFVEKAQDICHETLRNGEGKPLRDRIESLIGAFDGLGVTQKQLEARVGKERGQWTPEDVAQLTVAGQSIKRGEARAVDLFPAVESTSSTADEIAAAAPADEKPAKTRTTRTRKTKTDGKQSDPEPEPSAAEQPAEPEATQVTAQETRTGDGDTNEAETTVEETTADPGPGAQESDLRKAARQQLNAAIFATFGELKLNGDDQRPDRLVVIREIIGRQIDSTKDLTDDELQKLRNSLVSRKQSGTLEADVTDWLNMETIRQESAAGE